MSPRPLPARTSSCNVCIRPASPPVLAPNDPTGVQALSAARHGPPSAQAGTRDDDGGEGTDKPQEHEQTSVSTNADPRAAGSSTSIPWTIRNKYYTADVRFRVVSLAQWTPSVLAGVPATIFAFQRGEVRVTLLPLSLRRLFDSASTLFPYPDIEARLTILC